MTELYKVYILQCTDGTLYTGYAKCFTKRFSEHLTKKNGAKYTTRGVNKLVYINFFPTKSQALKEEKRIKSLSKSNKEKLLKDNTYFRSSAW